MSSGPAVCWWCLNASSIAVYQKSWCHIYENGFTGPMLAGSISFYLSFFSGLISLSASSRCSQKEFTFLTVYSWSWPPRIRSISGAFSARRRSFGQRIWVRATTNCTPYMTTSISFTDALKSGVKRQTKTFWIISEFKPFQRLQVVGWFKNGCANRTDFRKKLLAVILASIETLRQEVANKKDAA